MEQDKSSESTINEIGEDVDSSDVIQQSSDGSSVTEAANMTGEESIVPSPAQHRSQASVARCVDALNGATDVNQKFAALLMVTKLIKAEDLDDKAKIKLFTAIGIDFLTNLIREGTMPEGCPNAIFKSIALSILTCFVRIEPKISTFYCLIPDLLCIVTDPQLHDNDATLIQDALHCLEGIAAHKSGRQAIISQEGLTTIVDVYMLENFSQEFALKILITIMNAEISDCWLHAPDAFTKLVSHMCQEFCTNQSERKFELCLPLMEVLHSMPNSVPGDDGYEWQKQLHQGLSDIILSKLSKEQRYKGLQLAAVALDNLGATWVVSGGPKGHQLMLIMAHLACVEVRMSLENETFEKIIELASQTTSCYSILENAIKFLVNGAVEMEEKQKQQLYAALKGAFNAVLLFLKSVTEEMFHTSNKSTQLFVCATIRVLGAWLAEETAANKAEVYDILPFVIGMADYNYKWNKKVRNMSKRSASPTEDCKELPDLIRFLLPGLCHLTAEDEPRLILLQLSLDEQLFDYFMTRYEVLKYILATKKTDEESRTTTIGIESICDTLVTISSIFMNIAVTSPKEVQSKPLYLNLLKFIFSKVSELPADSTYLTLSGNLCVLGLMILKHQFMNVKDSDFGMLRFIQSTVRFLWDAHNVEESLDYATLVVSHKYHILWHELMELWYLGMHNLMMLLSHIPWLCDFLLECEWPQTVVMTLGQVKPTGIEASLKTVIEDMLCMIVRCSEAAKRALQQTGVAKVADVHQMNNLIAEMQK